MALILISLLPLALTLCPSLHPTQTLVQALGPLLLGVHLILAHYPLLGYICEMSDQGLPLGTPCLQVRTKCLVMGHRSLQAAGMNRQLGHRGKTPNIVRHQKGLPHSGRQDVGMGDNATHISPL